jgi:Glycosyl transferase family 11
MGISLNYLHGLEIVVKYFLIKCCSKNREEKMSISLQQCIRCFVAFSAYLILQIPRAAADETPAPVEELNLPFVTCDMRGGLGNQLFEIATTLAYAWDYGAVPIFPDLNRTNYRLNDHRDQLFFRLNDSAPARPFSSYYSEVAWHSPETIPFQPDQKLYGYFQSWQRFDRYRDRLLELFAPPQSVEDYLTQKYSVVISHPKTVSIHVRIANLYKHNEKIHYFVGMEYYKKAMALFPPDTLFVVFGDRIGWCKEHFSQLQRPCVFIEGNNEIQDLFLMSMMKHHIIPNSTFSWWASYLNKNPDHITIVPESWQHPDLFAFPMTQPNHFYLPNWTLISPNYYEAYPSDAEDYDNCWDGDV